MGGDSQSCDRVELGRRTMFEYIVPLIALGVGFAGGYGLREWKSRRRRAIAQQEYFRRHPEEGHYAA